MLSVWPDGRPAKASLEVVIRCRNGTLESALAPTRPLQRADAVLIQRLVERSRASSGRTSIKSELRGQLADLSGRNLSKWIKRACSQRGELNASVMLKEAIKF